MRSTVRMFVMLSMCFGTLYMVGCASIISGRTQDVTFKSVPDGATVVINGRETGKTPFTTLLERKSGQSVVFQKDGYRSEAFPLETTINGVFFGNIIFGGLLGSTTDSVTGAILQYSPSFYQATLTPLSAIDLPQQQENEVRTYIVTNYVKIIEELKSRAGSSPYVSALFSLLKISPDRQWEARDKILDLSEKEKDIAEFAKAVAKQYIAK